jgi:hypothetical protein
LVVIVDFVTLTFLLITMLLVASGIFQWGGLDRSRASFLALYASVVGFLIAAVFERILVSPPEIPWALLPLGLLIVVSAALLAYAVELKFRSFPLLVFQWGNVLVTSALLYRIGVAHVVPIMFAFFMVSAIIGLLAMITIAVSNFRVALESSRAHQFPTQSDD